MATAVVHEMPWAPMTALMGINRWPGSQKGDISIRCGIDSVRIYGDIYGPSCSWRQPLETLRQDLLVDKKNTPKKHILRKLKSILSGTTVMLRMDDKALFHEVRQMGRT